MCAYLAEFNREPWGAIKEAFQTFLELAEPVDLRAGLALCQLPLAQIPDQSHGIPVLGDQRGWLPH